MKTKKKLTAAIVVLLMLANGSVTAFAATLYATPADAVAGLTGREVQSVIDERIESGKTYGSIASEAGVLDEFKDAVYEIKEDCLLELVDYGTITQADADEILEIIKERQAICDGTGTSGATLGLGLGAGGGIGDGIDDARGLGSGQGIGGGHCMGDGRGNGGGRGHGGGRGMGNGLRNGSCMYR